MGAGMVVRELFTSMGLDIDGASFAQAELLVDGIKKGLELVKEGVTRVAEGFAEMVIGTAEAGDRIDELAQQTGLTTDALQEIGYAAGFSGVGLEELAHSMNFLARKGVKDVRTEMLNAAEAISKLPKDASRAQYAIEKFGRAGARMVPVLAAGREELERMFKEAPKLSPEAVKAAVGFNDAWDRLKGTIQGIAYEVGEPFLQPLQAVIDAVRDWVRENKALITQRLHQVITFVGKAARFLWDVLKGMGKALDWVLDNWRLLAILLGSVVITAIYANIGALALLAGKYILVGILATAVAWDATVAWLAAAWPFVLIALKIALLLLVLEDLYYFLTGGESVIGDLVGYAKQYLPTMFDTAWTAVKEFFAEMWRAAKFTIQGVKLDIQNAFVDAWAGVKKTAQALWDWIVDSVKGIAGRIGSGLVEGAKALLPFIPGGQLALAGADALFGGGASPAASAASSAGTEAPPVNQTSINAPITVNATAGMDEAALASATRQQFEDMLRTKATETKEAL